MSAHRFTATGTDGVSASDDKLAIMASSPADYKALGLSPTSIAEWEDGARTDGSAGTYEWWYFDAHLADGAKLVATFGTKNLADAGKPLSPVLRLDLDLADGRHFEEVVHYRPSAWAAAKDHADVRLGENRFSGNLHHYRIQASAAEVSVDMSLTAEVAPWRPATGFMLFGADRSRQFAWLPAVPQGRVTGAYSVDGERHETTGVGYHDHNWGNVALPKVVNDWYWARGQAGPYTVIASYVTSAKRYGYEAIPIFMLARDGVLVAEDSSKVVVERDVLYRDATTGKPVATKISYTYRDGDDTYVVSFTRNRDLVVAQLVDTLKGGQRLIARLARFDGAYLRFVGDLDISHRRGGELIEHHRAEAIWELMYLGHARSTGQGARDDQLAS